jgi:hypothetical protein
VLTEKGLNDKQVAWALKKYCVTEFYLSNLGRCGSGLIIFTTSKYYPKAPPGHPIYYSIHLSTLVCIEASVSLLHRTFIATYSVRCDD